MECKREVDILDERHEARFENSMVGRGTHMFPFLMKLTHRAVSLEASK